MSASSPFAQPTSTGLVVAIVGFFSSFPIVLQGLIGVGATEAEAASGLMTAAVTMGLAGIALSLWKRQPISVAWSTPGVALLAVAGAPEAGFAGAVAAFIFAGLLTLIAGLWRPLGRLAASVPAPLAQAMLAGVLVSLCVAPFRALAETPYSALPVVLTWFLVGRLNRLFAVPAAVLAAVVVIGIAVDFESFSTVRVFSPPVVIAPEFSLGVLLSIGFPLFVVTMATQNVPGIAILRSYGYAPPPGPLFSGVGAASVISAPLGAPATCLAAITAAMCADKDSHPDSRQRYRSAVAAGVFYCVFGLLAGAITGVAAVAPPMLLETLTGVALLGVFASSAAAALEQTEYREASAVTFLVTASGITVFGLGAAVWGLVLGCAVLFVTKNFAAS